jgi:predicted nucleic acid-binding protein
MKAKVFVDANILVYCWDASEPGKQQQALAWMEYLWRQRTGRLSFQVLQEFYITVTAKLAPGLPREEAVAEVRTLLAWQPSVVDARTLEAAWLVQAQHRLGWWDALIVAAAHLAGCRYLLSEDFQDDQTLGQVRVVNPFRADSAALFKP